MEVGSVLITGSNRGIGLEFVKQFLALPVPPKHVFAACRSPADAKELKELKSERPNVNIVKIDMGDLAALSTTVQEVDKVVGDAGLNLIINNAGMALRDSVDTVTSEQMLECFKVNAVGPMMVVQAFLPLLRKAASTRDGSLSISRAAVINISTGVASITENDTGRMYAYRTSKAGMNMITKNLSLDLKTDGILVTAIHPGWIKTGMGGSNAKTEASDCAKSLVTLMSTFTSEAYNGKFYHFGGREMPW